MLLNYLYNHFLEEHDFAQTCDLSLSDLCQLVERRVFPGPSYVYGASGRSASFVSDAADDTTYRFHLKGYEAWIEAIQRFGLDTEERARTHFFDRYNASRSAFLSSDLGKALTDVAPTVTKQFDADHANATWSHFLNGVYGVCTRDGLPESVFLKQSGVMFIEAMIQQTAEKIGQIDLGLLGRAVDFLDKVEAEFAPHEVEASSRKRCIIDVRKKYLGGLAG
ncbi:DUF6058 family natural product biosynthesis protein [uncultured Roseobacter sp.]|uniref:DUF6058 family natural product biosynthesis protein n=1 Tax=uncultured Roseobacter sp. TaxID=114847 RepID=UPI00263422EC|nr:DUF6058 family natural product biosynthesis protein [uncultured Roseobacter sp.]